MTLFSGGSETSNNTPKNKVKWPLNFVEATSAGHMFERNNTKGGERWRMIHALGNFYDMDEKNNTTVKVLGDEIHLCDHNMVLKVGTDLKSDRLVIQVIGDAHLVVEGDLHTKVQGDRFDTVDKNYNLTVGGVYTVLSKENLSIEAKNQMKLKSNSYENKTVFLYNDLTEGGSIKEDVKGNYEVNIQKEAATFSVRSEGDIRTEANKCSYEKVDGNKFTEIGAKYKTTVKGSELECIEGGAFDGMDTSLDNNEYKISTTGTMQINTTIQTQINGGGAVDINAGAIFLN